MRRAAAFCVLFGCRMNFAIVDDADSDGTTHTIDATPPSRCTASMVPGFAVGAAVSDLLAAEMPTGYSNLACHVHVTGCSRAAPWLPS